VFFYVATKSYLVECKHRLQRGHKDGVSRKLSVLFRFEGIVENQPWCPNGYSLFESSCYKIPARKLTWQDAKTFCEVETSHIITINNKEEDVVLSSMMRSLGIHEVWIGLNDLAYKDLYQWSDGTMVRSY
jgi:hypothetical protein